MRGFQEGTWIEGLDTDTNDTKGGLAQFKFRISQIFQDDVDDFAAKGSGQGVDREFGEVVFMDEDSACFLIASEGLTFLRAEGCGRIGADLGGLVQAVGQGGRVFLDHGQERGADEMAGERREHTASGGDNIEQEAMHRTGTPWRI